MTRNTIKWQNHLANRTKINGFAIAGEFLSYHCYEMANEICLCKLNIANLCSSKAWEVFSNSISMRKHFCVQRTFVISRDPQIDTMIALLLVFRCTKVLKNILKTNLWNTVIPTSHTLMTLRISFVVDKLKIFHCCIRRIKNAQFKSVAFGVASHFPSSMENSKAFA